MVDVEELGDGQLRREPDHHAPDSARAIASSIDGWVAVPPRSRVERAPHAQPSAAAGIGSQPARNPARNPASNESPAPVVCTGVTRGVGAGAARPAVATRAPA